MVHAANADLGDHVVDALDLSRPPMITRASSFRGMGKTLLAHFDDLAVIGGYETGGANRLAWRVRRSRISGVSSA